MNNKLVASLGFWFALLALAATATAQVPEKKTVYVKLGGSELVKIANPAPKMKLFISNDQIIDARPLQPDLILIYNPTKKIGYSTISVWDDSRQEVKAVLDVVVALDLTPLKEKLHELFPNEAIDVYGSETGIVLSGTVSSPEVVEQVLRLAQTYLPIEAKGTRGDQGTGHSGVGITNLLTVGDIQQVMLEVKFAEVRRDKNKDWQAALGLTDLGSSFTGAAGVSSVLSPLEFTQSSPGSAILPDGTTGQVISGTTQGLVQNPGSLLLNFADNPANIFVKIKDVTAALRFLQGEGLARLLAEPRLVTQSGQEASFLAGGEFPIPTVDDDGQPNIEYKDFGVGLIFTPVVLGNGKISLRVAPSVSSIASLTAIPTGISNQTFVVPSLNTRRLESTVQLYDGQTLALGGLLQDNIVEEVNKVPGLGDLPVIGALFRSSSFQQEKTDLLVTVTPHLVKPEQAGAISYPGQDFRAPNAFEFYLEGRLEGSRPESRKSSAGAKMPAPAPAMEKQGGLEGEFGLQPVAVK